MNCAPWATTSAPALAPCTVSVLVSETTARILLTEDAALLVELVDGHQRALIGRSVVLVHPAAERDGEADNHLVVVCLRLLLMSYRRGHQGRKRHESRKSP